MGRIEKTVFISYRRTNIAVGIMHLPEFDRARI